MNIQKKPVCLFLWGDDLCYAFKNGRSFEPNEIVIFYVYKQQFKWCCNCFFLAGFMTRCLSLAGSFPWAAVLMVGDTITTRTQLFVAVTGSFLLTSMSLDAHPLLRPYSMVFSSSRRKSTGERISFIGGPSETLWAVWFNWMICSLSWLAC